MSSRMPSPASAPHHPEPMVGTSAVAELIGRTEQWVQTQARAQVIPSYRLGGHLRFRLSEVTAWIDAQVNR